MSQSQFSFSCSNADGAMIDTAAQYSGTSRSEFVRRAAVAAAKATLASKEAMVQDAPEGSEVARLVLVAQGASADRPFRLKAGVFCWDGERTFKLLKRFSCRPPKGEPGEYWAYRVRPEDQGPEVLGHESHLFDGEVIQHKAGVLVLPWVAPVE